LDGEVKFAVESAEPGTPGMNTKLIHEEETDKINGARNHLKAARFKAGLLVNFGHYPKVEIEHIVTAEGRYRVGKR
jgi:hypothetical protein